MTTDATGTVGQVVETTIRDFVIEVYPEVERPPGLGELLVAGQPGEETFGVVVDIATGAADDSRRPRARSRDEEGHDRVVRANPHLAYLLRTTCCALVVAHRRDGAITAYLPPSPPRIWEPAAPCSPGDRAALAANADVLRPLVAGGPGYDDATAALVRSLAAESGDPAAYRLSAGKALTHLLTGDPPRLVALLRRIDNERR